MGAKKNDDNDDDAIIIPSSKKNQNDTRSVTTTNKQTTTMDIKALQQQYEAMIVGISRDSNSSNTNNTDQTTTLDQEREEIFEVTCNIPPELISILKKESLWSSVHVPTILTSIERKRRLLEIDLLQNLIHDYDDETADQLWSLWYTERDSHENATTLLYTATTYTNDPTTWKIAEQMLRQLILQHGIYWVEPMNRLATLYYLQGKYQSSMDLCRVILHIKPWHFGALSGMVGLYIQMNDMTQAKKWSEKRLPSYVPEFIDGKRNSNQRRVEWVNNAVAQAKLALYNAEQILKLSFGDNDDENIVVRSPPPTTRHHDDDDDENKPRRDDDAVIIPTLDTDTSSWQ